MEDILSEIKYHNNMFYVYGLFLPNGKVFYIGKGKNRRIFDHLSDGDIKNSHNRNKKKTIKDILESGEEVGLKIFKFFYQESEAFKLEKELIAYFGKAYNRTGILANLSDGGCGPSGHKLSDEAKKNISLGHIGLVRSEKHKLSLSIVNSTKPVVCLETGMVFQNLPLAAKWCRENGYLKASGQNIHKVIKGQRNKAYGHTWDYASNFNGSISTEQI